MARYCTVCEFTPGHCGFDPMVCQAIELYSSNRGQAKKLKVLRVTTQVEFWDGAAGYATVYHTEDYKEFQTKAEAVKYISDTCDLHEIR